MGMREMQAEYILAVDPGTVKCGLAVMGRRGELILQVVIPGTELVDRLIDLARLYNPGVVILGDGTGVDQYLSLIEDSDLSQLVLRVATVDEHLTSLEARRRYLLERRERGKWWHRLVPLGMQVPDRPYDDYVAVILAERYLQSLQSGP